MGTKDVAWKDAVGLFIVIVAVHFGWNFFAGTKESWVQIFGVSAVPALFVYFLKRKDLFD